MQRVVIYSAIVTIVFTIFLNIPGFKKEVSPLGNVLSSYFYYLHSNTTEDIPAAYAHHIKTMSDQELKRLYKNFNWQRIDSVAYNSARDTTWQLYNNDGSLRENYTAYWQAVRPTMQKFYTDYITPVAIDEPVVHFRCSDAPFVTHPMYHLTKATTVKWMAEQIKSRGYDHIVILSCNKHNRVNNSSCDKYYNFYAQIFNAAGIKVKKQCHSIYQDFAIMVNAPLLVALNQSSYSFMAGIAKDPHNFISCNLGREHKGKYLLHTQADWIQSQDAPLLHSQVKDYYNTKEVIAQLNQSSS